MFDVKSAEEELDSIQKKYDEVKQKSNESLFFPSVATYEAESKRLQSKLNDQKEIIDDGVK